VPRVALRKGTMGGPGIRWQNAMDTRGRCYVVVEQVMLLEQVNLRARGVLRLEDGDKGCFAVEGVKISSKTKLSKLEEADLGGTKLPGRPDLFQMLASSRNKDDDAGRNWMGRPILEPRT